MAESVPGTGVTINSVLPGPTLTEGVREMLGHGGHRRRGGGRAGPAGEFIADERPTSLLRTPGDPRGGGEHGRLRRLRAGLGHHRRRRCGWTAACCGRSPEGRRRWPTPTAFVYGPHLQAYNPSDDTERVLRRELGIELLRAYGLLDHPDVTCIDPRPATDAEIQSVHDPAYVGAVRRYSDDPALAAEPEGKVWGFQDGDTQARPGMHQAAAAVCGAALTGALEIWEGRARPGLLPGAHRPAPRDGQPGLRDVHLQRRRGRDPGPARPGRRADRVHRRGRAPRQRLPVDLLRGPAGADLLGARERPLPVPGHRRPGRARVARRRGHLDQRAAAPVRRRRRLPARGAGRGRPGGAPLPPGGGRDHDRGGPAPHRPDGPPPGDHLRVPAPQRDAARPGLRRRRAAAGWW